MKNEIKVIYVTKADEYKQIMNLYQDQTIQNTFQGYRTDRLAASEITFLIYHNNTPIGFILLVRENQRRNSLGIDIAIKKEYRGNGYGKLAMEIFKEHYLPLIEEHIHVQVSKNNIPANKVISVLDKEYLETIDNSDYYQIINNHHKK